MQKTKLSPKIDESYVIRKLNKLDFQEKIDLSKVFNSLHLKRIISNLIEESNSFQLKDVFDPEMIMIAIKSRHYNYLRPEGAIKYDPLTFDFKKLNSKEREQVLDFPLDELREMIGTYLQLFYKLPQLSDLQMFDLADFFTKSFADTVYCESLWDYSLVMSIVSIVAEKRYE